MKKTILNGILLLALPAMLSAQYTGGSGRGDASALLSSSPLPVELVSFTGIAEQSAIVLSWQTATEVNNAGFAVERKTLDAWTKIGFVDGKGTTNAPTSYRFSDNAVTGKNIYRLKQIDRDGNFQYSKEIEVVANGMPKAFDLGQNYPNPFNPSTTITYSLPAGGSVSLKVYDALGREAATLVNETKAAGTYTAQFDGTHLSSGIYFARLQSGGKIQMRKMQLLK